MKTEQVFPPCEPTTIPKRRDGQLGIERHRKEAFHHGCRLSTVHIPLIFPFHPLELSAIQRPHPSPTVSTHHSVFTNVCTDSVAYRTAPHPHTHREEWSMFVCPEIVIAHQTQLQIKTGNVPLRLRIYNDAALNYPCLIQVNNLYLT